MIKGCANCQKLFKTRDSRQKTCSKECADRCRAANAWKPNRETTPAREPILPPPPVVARPTAVLPPPEELPAPYAKRVHDMWAALIGDAPTRIA